jgi:hypothetical protein
MASRTSFAVRIWPTARSFLRWTQFQMTDADLKRSFGANSRLRAPLSSVPCSMEQFVVLQRLPHIRLEKLPRMADFALWGTACETAYWPLGTFLRAYDANRRAVIDGVIEADPVATFVREIMPERSAWTGRASDLLRAHIAAGDALDRTWPNCLCGSKW